MPILNAFTVPRIVFVKVKLSVFEYSPWHCLQLRRIQYIFLLSGIFVSKESIF